MSGKTDPPPPYEAQAGGGPPPPGFALPLSDNSDPSQKNAGYYAYPGSAGLATTAFVGSSTTATQPATTVIVSVPGYGPYPQQTTCPNCNANVMTETNASPGLLTWILSATCLLIGCWAGCCLIPCCIPECQDIEHSCPNCKARLGVYRRI